MKAKTYLSQLKNYRSDIRRLKLQIREINEAMTSVAGMRYDKDRVQSSPDNPTEAAMIRFISSKERLNNLLIRYNDKYVEITIQIDGLENPLYREILKQYFVEDRKLYQIADRLKYSERYVYNCFEAGLSEFEQKYLSGGKHG